MDALMNTGNARRRLEGVVRILRPLISSLLEWSVNHQGLRRRLQHVDNVIQMAVQDLEQPAADSAVVQSVSSTLKSIAKDMDSALSLSTRVSSSFSSRSWKGAEQTVRFIHSLSQILQDIYDHEAEMMDVFIPAKKEILDVYEELKVMEIMFWLINSNPLLMDHEVCSYLGNFTENIALQISCLLYTRLMNDKMDDTEMVSRLKEQINRLQIEVQRHYEGINQKLRFTRDIGTPKLDEHVVCFFDYLIGELRKLLSHNGASSIVAGDLDDQIEMLVEELCFLRSNLPDIIILHQQEEEVKVFEEMKSLCLSTQILIMETAFLVYFSGHRGEKEKETIDYCGLPKQQASDYWRFGLPDLLERVESIKQQASDLFRNQVFSLSSRSCGSTNQMGSVSSLIKNLEKLMHSHAAQIDGLNYQIQTVYQETLSLRYCLAEIVADNEFANSQSQIEFLEEQFEEAAHKSSHIIDSILLKEFPLWYHRLGMFVVESHIKVVQREMKAFPKVYASYTIARGHSVSCPTSSLPSSSTQNNSTTGSKDKKIGIKMEESPDKIVGVKDEVKEVIELLTSPGATRLKIISIVGMPGIGKTTLANSVYMHPSIRAHFHVRAWCYASQSYEKEALLFEILSQLVGETNENLEVREKDLALKLRKILLGMKYLIVIDDVWDVNLWNDLKETFPDNHNGSRILFTTRHRAVALKTNSTPYALRLLSNKESCELLLFKVFDGKNCTPELSVISNRIARNCKGLPLAVVLVAGILKRTEMRKDSWESVAKTVFHFDINKAKDKDIMDFRDILEFSYKHLPDYLKPCFLYFAAIPEETSISVSKLIRLWISKDFVQGQNLGQKSLEQEAKDYLNELLDRSLVMMVRTSSRGGVKACRVHDVLRRFCSYKFDKEGFVLSKDGFISNKHADVYKRYTTFLYDCRSYRFTNYRPLRLQNVSNENDFLLEPRLQQSAECRVFRDEPLVVREVLSQGVVVTVNQSNRFNYDVIFKCLMLTVLDLGNVRVQSSAETSDLVMIAKLTHLRYLAIRPRRNEIPPEMGSLLYLETFVLSGVIGHIMLPESVWNLANLRHLLTDHGFFSFQHCSQEFFENLSQLDNLKSVSTLPLMRGNNIENFILRSLTGIEKLGCRLFADSWDDSAGCSIFPELNFLSELRSLKIFFSGKVLCPCKFSFPSNLTKLSISNSRLPWNEISVVGQLPNLEVLKLLNKAVEGQQWDMKDGEFQKLKFLKLESLDIEIWNAFAPDDLPFLEQLVVLHCPQLKEIPYSLGEIATLKLIEMKWCSFSAMDSVSKVVEFQRDMSNDELRVNLVRPEAKWGQMENATHPRMQQTKSRGPRGWIEVMKAKILSRRRSNMT